MTGLSRHSWHVWQRNRDVFFRLWRSEAPGFLVEPFIILLGLGLGLGAYVGLIDGQAYIGFIAPGIVASYAMFSSTFECTYGAFVRMEYQNTYDAILATPINAGDIIAGEILWGATRALMTGTAILAIAAVLGLVSSPWAVLVPVICFAQGIMFGALSLVFTSLVPAIYTFNYFFTLFINPMFFLSGVFFPLSSFPVIVQRLSWVAPLTPVVNLTRAAFAGEFPPELLLSVIYVAGLSAVFFAIALITMKRRLTR
ncbi:MAG: ABC transporter permease [Chloroflexi bacterium]|nr:ABC transporter permease [Chloroflexota bacterium]